MRVRNPRVALLSDYEVLTFIRGMRTQMQEEMEEVALAADEAEEVGLQQASIPNGKLADSSLEADGKEEAQMQSIPANLRAIQYALDERLSNVFGACAHQEESHINAFLDAISAWERGRSIVGLETRLSTAPISKEVRLTKGERLMIVNHAPTTDSALFTIVEFAQDRFSDDEREDLLSIIAHTLPLDTGAIQEENNRAAAASEQQKQQAERDLKTELVEVVNEEEGYEDDAYIEDMEALENEGRGEGAVDDEPKEDD